MKFTRFAIAMVLLAGIPSALSAQTGTAADAPFSVTPAGDAYFTWRQNWTTWYPNWDERRQTTGDSDFSLDRVRLGADGHGPDGFYDIRLLIAATQDEPDDTPYDNPDADPQSDWETYPQHAWVRLNFHPAVRLAAGLLPTSYILFLEDAWRYRFVEKSAYERWLYRRAPLVPKPFVTEDNTVEIRAGTVPIGTPTPTDLG
ncbi:hypothetical protein KDL45_17025, partial [bacterium]|nr:hypothetical protein [bacterium]